MSSKEPLLFKVISKCSTSKARTSLMKLPNFEVELPMFMPVGTQGTMKGLIPEQLEEVNSQIILGNTYHLGTRPGRQVLDQYGGLHKFMNWNRALLTDSGGFQMVSLLKLAEITEEGVKFQSPYDGSECMLTPEESIHIQNSIGADIMMQLDDVVHVNETDYARFKVATERTTRWLDRCLKANQNPETQNLFAIIQGGLFPDLRKQSLRELIERNASGYAIGGLSGGEDKSKFWSVVNMCTDELPELKPRYCMGVGFPVDLVVCCALGVDMFDCVYPTRTARFGCALVDGGQISLKNIRYRCDFTPIDAHCECPTCRNYTRAYIRSIVTKETVGCHLISVHNIFYLMQLMKKIRESIKEDCFPEFVKEFMKIYYKDKAYPDWVVDALESVNILLEEKGGKVEEKMNNVWEEDDSEDLDKMSGFERTSYNQGVQDGLWSDRDDTESGRVSGYLKASTSTVKIRDDELIPPRRLSQWQGTLLACLSVNKDVITPDMEKEIADMIKRIDSLIKVTSKPNEEAIKLVYEDSSRQVEYSENVIESISKVNDDCRNICDKLHWAIPSILE